MMTQLAVEDVPRLPRGVRMRFDAVRNAHVLLAPERAFDLDEIATEVLKLVDGERSVGAIVDELAIKFDADRRTIEADVIEMLADLVNKRILER
jgi:pyrroloquinoline quinone biosynthesis protein D